MGAVVCKKHGTQPGPLCCDHVREAVEGLTAATPFGVYRFDVTGVGTELLEHMLCTECASKFGLLVNELISEDVWGNEGQFPYMCPTCEQCFVEWRAQPIRSVQEGLERIDAFVGDTEAFELAVPDSLLDSFGMNMAMLTDRVLARGWLPNGFVQHLGYRIYQYKAAD